jgi:hypothetical protein
MTDSPSQEQAGNPFAGADPTRDIRRVALPRLKRQVVGEPSTVDQPTDQLNPPFGRPRERTIAFASPEAAVGRPKPSVGRTPRSPRRWPWVVLALLPVLVIAVSGVWWVLLLRSA